MRLRFGLRLLAAALTSLVCSLPVAAQSGTLLVSIIGEKKVVMMDAATGKVLAEIPVEAQPHEITLSRDGSLAYVAPGGPNDSVAVLDLKARKVRAVFPTCARLHDTRISRDGKVLWAACGGAKAVAELDALTGRKLRTYDVKLDGGWFVEVAADEKKLYVPHLDGKGFSVTNRASGETRIIYEGSTLLGVTASPDGREVWASDADAAELKVLDTKSDQIVATVSLPRPIGRDGKPAAAFARVKFAPDGRIVLVVRDQLFLVVDANSRTIRWSIDMPHPGKVPAVSADGRYAFVSHPSHDAVSVIDLVAQKLAAKFTTGKQPDGVAWVGAR